MCLSRFEIRALEKDLGAGSLYGKWSQEKWMASEQSESQNSNKGYVSEWLPYVREAQVSPDIWKTQTSVSQDRLSVGKTEGWAFINECHPALVKIVPET